MPTELRATKGGILGSLQRKYDSAIERARSERSRYFYENILPNLVSYLPKTSDFSWLSALQGQEGPSALVNAAAAPTTEAWELSKSIIEGAKNLPDALSAGARAAALDPAYAAYKAAELPIEYANRNPLDAASIFPAATILPKAATPAGRNVLAEQGWRAGQQGLRGISHVVPETAKDALPISLRLFLHYLTGKGTPVKITPKFDDETLSAIKELAEAHGPAGVSTAKLRRMADIILLNRVREMPIRELRDPVTYTPATLKQHRRALSRAYRSIQEQSFAPIDVNTMDVRTLAAALKNSGKENAVGGDAPRLLHDIAANMGFDFLSGDDQAAARLLAAEPDLAKHPLAPITFDTAVMPDQSTRFLDVDAADIHKAINNAYLSVDKTNPLSSRIVDHYRFYEDRPLDETGALAKRTVKHLLLGEPPLSVFQNKGGPGRALLSNTGTPFTVESPPLRELIKQGSQPTNTQRIRHLILEALRDYMFKR